MQKKLIALAVAALATGSAFAQSNVAISGYISSGYSNSKVSNTGAAQYRSENRIDDGRYSRIRFTGTEDLGNGLKAEFQLETRLSMETGGDATTAVGAFGSGDQWVGVSGAFGRVRLGRMDQYYSDGVLTELTRATSFQSFATLSLLAQSGNDTTSLGTAIRQGRHDNQVRYDTPNWSGFSATTSYSFSPNTNEGTGLVTAGVDGGKGGEWYVAGRYFNGPIYAGLSYINRHVEGTASQNHTGTRAYGSYTFPFGLKIGLNIDKTRAETATGALSSSRTAYFLPVSYTFGANTVYATYGRAGNYKAAAGRVNDSGAVMWNLAYDYALSKRTSVGANYTVLNNGNNAQYRLFAQGTTAGLAPGLALASDPGLGMTARQLYVGVNHNF